MKDYGCWEIEKEVKKKWNSKLRRRTLEQTFNDYDEVLSTLNRDDIEIIDVFGPPPPTKKIDGEWVWKTNRIFESLHWIIEYVYKN